jgi:hypothetical protein
MERHVTFIFRVEEWIKQEATTEQVATRQIRLPSSLLSSCINRSIRQADCFAYSSTPKMEVICSSETSIEFRRTVWRYNPEDGTLHNRRCENLRSYNDIVVNRALSKVGISYTPFHLRSVSRLRDSFCPSGGPRGFDLKGICHETRTGVGLLVCLRLSVMFLGVILLSGAFCDGPPGYSFVWGFLWCSSGLFVSLGIFCDVPRVCRLSKDFLWRSSGLFVCQGLSVMFLGSSYMSWTFLWWSSGLFVCLRLPMMFVRVIRLSASFCDAPRVYSFVWCFLWCSSGLLANVIVMTWREPRNFMYSSQFTI